MVEREYGRGAEMLVARAYLGLEQREMAGLLDIRPQTYQRWENGDDRIPTTIWPEVEQLRAKFDQDVADLLDAADAGHTTVPVSRRALPGRPIPGWWQRVVSEAMRENRAITPRYPEDLQTEEPN